MPDRHVKSALLDYLLTAEKRPGMYFGSYDVDLVRHHLDGWNAHRRVVPDADLFADQFFGDFHTYVQRHYQDNRTVGWNGLIRENTSSDQDGFETFMSLLKRFVADVGPHEG